MRDVTKATGVKRGGLYNHFASKDQLAAESFDYAVGLFHSRIGEQLDDAQPPPVRLKQIVDAFVRLYAEDPPFPCGCVLFNTAVEARCGMQVLRGRAQVAMDGLLELVGSAVRAGRENGTLDDAIDAEEAATVFVATLEGAVVLSVLYDDPAHIERAANHLHRYVDRHARNGG